MSEGGGDIIIKKIKKGGHAAHGGAWKIAYADFVTAMMAFFLLLWLLSSASEETLKGVAEYFTPTIGLKDEMGIGFDGGQGDSEDGKKKEGKADASAIVFGAPTQGALVQVPDSAQTKADQIDAKNFTSMENDLYKAIYENPELKEFDESILIEQTPEGLKIQLLDSETRPMFVKGTTELQPYTKKLLQMITRYIRYLPNYISIAGHTSSEVTGPLGNWELSSARAEATRKFLVSGQISPEQVYRVVGKGDQDPIEPKNLYAPRNNRLSLLLLKNTLIPFQKRAVPENIELE
jgi:chemotaxis protein MotB